MHAGVHQSSPFEAVAEACALATATLISVARVVAMAAATARALSVHAVWPVSGTHTSLSTTIVTVEQHFCVEPACCVYLDAKQHKCVTACYYQYSFHIPQCS